jgi:hypothetical protein
MDFPHTAAPPAGHTRNVKAEARRRKLTELAELLNEIIQDVGI